MRVLQIIDSLNAGGAEQMAVNYANELSQRIEFSAIVVTRKEGVLKDKLNDNVFYYFLDKKSTLDFKSINKLKNIIVQNKINTIHAHGTSFFNAFLVKLFFFKIKIVFHEHYGGRANQSLFKNLPLLFCCFFFNKIIVVNRQIEIWFHQKGFKKAVFFSNFATFDVNEIKETRLEGDANRRIICLANLKNPKNHQVLIKAFYKSKLKETNWSLHFVGKIHYDQYYDNLIALINNFDLGKVIYFYGSKPDISNILSQATIGVLCSTAEGFPVTLLEYGLGKLSVIAPNVGFCPQLIIHNETGLLFESNNVEELTLILQKLTKSESLRKHLATNLTQLVVDKYNKKNLINELVSLYNKI
jgi:glycosyltransferase involved in cell wall biosynthesis